MDLGIAGERALVLGGTQGLGLSCAWALANEGVAVAAVGRDPAAGAAAARSLAGRAVYVRADLSVATDRDRLIEDARAALGEPISILVTNAGGPPTGEFAEHSTDAWLAALQVNMLGHLEIARKLLPGMIGGGFGRIVNITSFAAKEPYPNMALANGVRAGLHGAMSTLAREVADKGVTVNNLLPGLIDTGALQRVFRARMEKDGVDEAEVRARMAGSIPAGRLGLADDFGPACAFLCSRHAGYITAQNLAVDGGLIRGLF